MTTYSTGVLVGNQPPAAMRPWAILAAVVLGALCARLAIGGLPVQTGYPFAASILLDAGSRIRDGQIPYQDFHTPIGFTYLGLLAGFLRLSDGLPHALSLLGAFAGAAVGAWAWWLAVARCAPPLAAAVAIVSGLLVASPALYGFGPLEVSHGGHYSRLAWGVFATVILQAAIPSRGAATRTRNWGEGLGLGICLGLLVGIKFTFLFAAVILLIACWWYRRPHWHLVATLLAGALLATGAGLLASGASMTAYLRDCLSLGGSVTLPELLLHYRRKLDLLSLALAGALALWLWPIHRASWQPSWRQPLPEAIALALTVLALGLVLSATTGIEDASPCYLFVILVLASAGPRSATDGTALRCGALLAGAVLCAFAARLAMPIVKGPYAAASHRLTLAAGPWRGLDFMPAVAGTLEPDRLIPYVWIQPSNLVDNLWYLYLADGDRLLRPLVGPRETVLCMDYINPFPYQLERPAPRGDLLYWSFDRNVTARTAPAAEVLFADADWVMVPKLELFHDSSAPKQLLYRDWIRSHYLLVASTTWWDCHRRR